MLKSIILIIRDYSYLRWLKKSNDPRFAWRQQKQMVIGLLIGWYISLWTILALVNVKAGWHIFPQSANFFVKLVYSTLLFGPYITFMWWWLDTLDDIAVDEAGSYERKRIITWSTSIAGFLMAVLMPVLLQKILP